VNPHRSRIAVVTGASSGIGRAIARELHGLGAAVVVNARRRERLEDLARELGGERVAIVPGDAAEQGVIDAMLDTARDRFGRDADLVVVNAGRGLAGSVHDSDASRWEEMLRVNVLGAARLMRAALARMQAGGAAERWPHLPRDIVVMGSNVGKHISPFSSMYGSTKFAVGALAEGMRRAAGPAGIRVTLVAPGIVRSEFQAVAGYDPASFGAYMERVGPVLEPEDVARLIGFVVSQPAHVHINDVLIRPTRQDYP
jgi:NADP-dependent 3-hydroxy acid dehydrogenase YdfG